MCLLFQYQHIPLEEGPHETSGDCILSYQPLPSVVSRLPNLGYDTAKSVHFNHLHINYTTILKKSALFPAFPQEKYI